MDVLVDDGVHVVTVARYDFQVLIDKTKPLSENDKRALKLITNENFEKNAYFGIICESKWRPAHGFDFEHYYTILSDRGPNGFIQDRAAVIHCKIIDF